MIVEVAQLVPYEYGRARVPGYKNNSAGIFYDLPKDVAKFKAGKRSDSINHVGNLYFHTLAFQSLRPLRSHLVEPSLHR